MTEQRSFNLLHPQARLAGVVYLLYFLIAILAQFLTARKFATYGNGSDLIATAFYCFLTLLFYGLFKPVNRILSFLAALFSLAGCVLTTLDFTLPTPPTISPLLFFAPYCLQIGYLIFRSTFLPAHSGFTHGRRRRRLAGLSPPPTSQTFCRSPSKP